MTHSQKSGGMRHHASPAVYCFRRDGLQAFDVVWVTDDALKNIPSLVNTLYAKVSEKSVTMRHPSPMRHRSRLEAL
jgi:hypothetical protein